jgi:ribosome-associated toxin RatA of RatAB toxin-antitoxin module
MRQVRRSALVPYSAEQMYALVNDVAAYDQFLPWCRTSRVLESSDRHMRAEIEMSLAGFTRRFSTRNTLTPGEHIHMKLVDGPFRHLEGNWRFHALSPEACKVYVDMEFKVANAMFEFALAPAFEKVCNSLVDSFIERAGSVYGTRTG